MRVERPLALLWALVLCSGAAVAEVYFRSIRIRSIEVMPEAYVTLFN